MLGWAKKSKSVPAVTRLFWWKKLAMKVACFAEVGRQGGVAAAEDSRVRDLLQEGLVPELDRGVGELDFALDPVGVDLVTGLPHDDVVDLVARRPARRRA